MHFRVKKLSRLKKSERKDTIFYSFSVLLLVTVTIYKALAQETKDRGDSGTATQKLEETKKIE